MTIFFGQSRKVFSSTSQPLGMEMLVRLEQREKALCPISVTDEGMEMLVRLEQPKKAPSPNSVTDGGMIVFLQPHISVLLIVCIKALQSSRE